MRKGTLYLWLVIATTIFATLVIAANQPANAPTNTSPMNAVNSNNDAKMNSISGVQPYTADPNLINKTNNPQLGPSLPPDESENPENANTEVYVPCDPISDRTCSPENPQKKLDIDTK